MAVTGKREDPLRNFNYLVELDGIAQGSFTECSGLGSTTEVVEHREGGNNTTPYKLPGKTTYPDITLKWGLTASAELWKWRQQIVDGVVVRKNGSIVMFDQTNKVEMARWNFVEAWPSKWEGPSLNAKGTDVAIETLVLSHEGIKRA